MNISPASLRLWRAQSEEQFLVDCRCDVFRGSGPGGQKRNKTSSAVRLTHIRTALFSTSSESRSQNENKTHALRRLRHRLAIELHCPVDAGDSELAKLGNALKISLRDEQYLPFVGQIVDILAESVWSISAAGAKIGSSTGQLIAFLSRDEPLWAYVNQQRTAAGLRALNLKK